MKRLRQQDIEGETGGLSPVAAFAQLRTCSGLRRSGDLFDKPAATDRRLALGDATWLPPIEPRQFIGLWNNFHERQQLEKTRIPDFPLFFMKLDGSLSAHQRAISRPPGFNGRIKFEAELGIVIGQHCFQPSMDEIEQVIFGYTCVNDVTAPELLFANEEFHQWCRSKSLPGFGPIGPVIATGIDPAGLRVRGVLDGEVKQDYPVSDMIFSPHQIIWHIAREIVLYPGDVIACGTSVGAADMADGQTIVVEIPGIGGLTNRLTRNDSPYTGSDGRCGEVMHLALGWQAWSGGSQGETWIVSVTITPAPDLHFLSWL